MDSFYHKVVCSDKFAEMWSSCSPSCVTDRALVASYQIAATCKLGYIFIGYSLMVTTLYFRLKVARFGACGDLSEMEFPIAGHGEEQVSWVYQTGGA